MGYSVFTWSAIKFIQLVFVCNSLTQAIRPRRSVCGSGPYSFEEPGLDIYVLIGKKVTLLTRPHQTDIRIISWSPNVETARVDSRIVHFGKEWIIGPMDNDFNLLRLGYSSQRDSTATTFRNNTVTVYLAATHLDMIPDKGLETGQIISMTVGSSAQLVYCFKLVANAEQRGHIPPTTVVLKRQHFSMESTEFPSNRYHIGDGCLWIRTLQKENSGKYSLELKTCFSFRSDLKLNFSVTVRLAPQPISFHSVAAKEVNVERISKVAIRSPRKSVGNAKITLKVMSHQKNGTSAAGTLTICAAAKENITLQYNVTGLQNRKIVIFHNGTKLRRDSLPVEKIENESLIKIVNFNQSYNGRYVVKVRGKLDVSTKFKLILIKYQPKAAASCPPSVSTSPTRNSATPTTAVNKPTTKPLTRITGNTTSSHPTASTKSKIYKEGWFLFIIIFCILLVIIIPTIYLSYKHRQFLRRRCCDLTTKNGKYNEMTAVVVAFHYSMHICILFVTVVMMYHEQTKYLLQPQQNQVMTKKTPSVTSYTLQTHCSYSWN
jgi:hypothetical protein